MDLGIQGRKAIVMASSQGLGRACALALAAEGCEVIVNGRDAGKLEATRKEIQAATGSKITAAVADVTTDSGRTALLEACPAPDILVTNNAGPPPGSIEDWDHQAWISAWEANMLPQALMIRAVLPWRAQGVVATVPVDDRFGVHVTGGLRVRGCRALRGGRPCA